jgi:hypothetical protein
MRSSLWLDVGGWVVAPVVHGHADHPVSFGDAQCGNGQGNKSMVGSDTKFLFIPWSNNRRYTSYAHQRNSCLA